jgi:predicted TIM-barrel fold metal-dependent hydrolase
MPIWDERKIDCHHHVIDPVRFPYAPDTVYRPQGQEVAPVEVLLQLFDIFAVRHGVVVGTNSGYGTDNRIVLDAIRRSAGRLKGVAVVPNSTGSDALADLKAQGIVGVAINPSAWGLAYYQDVAPLVARVEELGMFVQVQTEKDQLVDLMELIGPTNVRILIDHCARPVVAAGLEQKGFCKALELGRSGQACVKISGYAKFSETMYPHVDAGPFIEALVEAFTLDRCMWGSDWPYLKADHHIDFAMMLKLIEAWFPDSQDRARLFWDTPARVFGFDAAHTTRP